MTRMALIKVQVHHAGELDFSFYHAGLPVAVQQADADEDECHDNLNQPVCMCLRCCSSMCLPTLMFQTHSPIQIVPQGAHWTFVKWCEVKQLVKRRRYLTLGRKLGFNTQAQSRLKKA